ncbi:MFS transporter [Paraburkholderia sp. IMGN_8]|uniref:MFS transporter n=1 Tax=Paraburkholderia sp. IMGN_8 TaxID=3136564 RepID=UPI0031015A70
MKTLRTPHDWSGAAAPLDSSQTRSASGKRLFFASFLGTMVEWYDFFLYGFIAPLVFEELFFPKLTPLSGTIAVYATFAVGYASRPLGGLIFGHFGDKVGRKSMMLVTLLMMGVGTTLIGFLPSYGQIGIAATYALVILRFFQGFALGGESAAASLMVLENAAQGRRGFLGAALQSAGPLGVLLASLAVFLVSRLPHETLLSWGWRVPFLLSAVLVVIGIYIRLRVEETYAFKKQQGQHELARVPVLETLRNYKWPVFAVLVVSITESTFYYLTGVYSVSFVTKTMHMPGSVAIGAIACANAFALVSVPIYGALSDRLGRKGVYLIGIVASAIYLHFFFQLLLGRSPTVIVLAVVIAVGVIHAPMYAMFGSFYGELFPTRVRFTGFSMGKAFGTVLGGGIAPMIAATLVARNHGDPSGIGVYYLCLAVVALVVILRTRETCNADIAE